MSQQQRIKRFLKTSLLNSDSKLAANLRQSHLLYLRDSNLIKLTIPQRVLNIITFSEDKIHMNLW